MYALNCSSIVLFAPFTLFRISNPKEWNVFTFNPSWILLTLASKSSADALEYDNSKISRIYELSSNIHISENRDPEIYEVSTYIKPLK
jgi:hypothetical protein